MGGGGVTDSNDETEPKLKTRMRQVWENGERGTVYLLTVNGV